MGVQRKDTWSTSWSCLHCRTARWKISNCQHLCVRSYRNVSCLQCLVHGRSNWSSAQIFLGPNFTTGLTSENVWVCCKVGAKVHEWARYEICCVSLKRFRLEGGNTLNSDKCNRWKVGKGIRTGTQTTVLYSDVQPPWEHKVQQHPSPTKMTTTLASEVHGVLLCHPASHGWTVTAQYYEPFLQYHLIRVVREKRPETTDLIIL